MSNTPPDKRTEWLKYSGMGFQFLGACLLGFLLGRWLDEKFQNTKAVWTAVCTTFFMIAVIVNIYVDVLKKK
jgi:F0F1-type ATP synthase assembly protein I